MEVNKELNLETLISIRENPEEALSFYNMYVFHLAGIKAYASHAPLLAP